VTETLIQAILVKRAPARPVDISESSGGRPLKPSFHCSENQGHFSFSAFRVFDYVDISKTEAFPGPGRFWGDGVRSQKFESEVSPEQGHGAKSFAI
jgi:hypothetical protein